MRRCRDSGSGSCCGGGEQDVGDAKRQDAQQIPSQEGQLQHEAFPFMAVHEQGKEIQALEEERSRRFLLEYDRKALEGQIYPTRLHPVPEKPVGDQVEPHLPEPSHEGQGEEHQNHGPDGIASEIVQTNHPLALALIALCGCVEYFTSVYLEYVHDGTRWWDYTGYFLNLHGRICAEGLLVFGIGGMAIVYVLAPFLDGLRARAPAGTRPGC